MAAPAFRYFDEVAVNDRLTGAEATEQSENAQPVAGRRVVIADPMSEELSQMLFAVLSSCGIARLSLAGSIKSGQKT